MLSIPLVTPQHRHAALALRNGLSCGRAATVGNGSTHLGKHGFALCLVFLLFLAEFNF